MCITNNRRWCVRIRPNTTTTTLCISVWYVYGRCELTPIVLGSLPHLELPTLYNQNNKLEDIGDDSKPNGIWDNIKDFFAPKDVDVQNEESGNINNLTRLSRQKQ